MRKKLLEPALLPAVAFAALLGAAGCTKNGPSNPNNPNNNEEPRMNSFQAILGESDPDYEKERWNTKLRSERYFYGKEPIPFLKQNISRLPHSGQALVLPLEEGRNAVFLAVNGLQVTGVDFSDVAIRKAKRLAKERGVSVKAVNADLNGYAIKPSYYDVIVVSEFYRPKLVEQIKVGLKPGGTLLFESHTVDQVKNKNGESIRRDYLLKQGELKSLFQDFELLTYKETNDGTRAVASLVARKPLR